MLDMLAPVLVTPAAATPVSLDDTKRHLRVDGADDDALITSLINAATGYLDGWSGILGRALVTQSWRQDLRCWPVSRHLRLPLSPVQSITSVVYSDPDNADQTLDAAGYRLFGTTAGPVVSFDKGLAFPALYDRPDAVRITFVAGYGDAADVPAPIRHAILLMVGGLWASAKADPTLSQETVYGVGQRQWDTTGAITAGLQKTIDALVAPFRAVAL